MLNEYNIKTPMGDRSVNLNQRLPSLDSDDSFGGDLSALAIR
jgi:hypothetical protein